MTRLSVVIPTYNHARYIARAINSVLTQANEATEILVVDDGSTDDTPEQIRAIGHPITYLRTINQGPAAARNLGVQKSTGELVLFLDADDALQEGALESIRNCEARWPSADLYCGGYLSVDRQDRRKQRPLPRITSNKEHNFRACIRGKLELQIGATAVRRRVFSHVHFPEHLQNGEDVVFFAQALSKFESRLVDSHLVAKFDHAHRLRNDTKGILDGGTAAVEALFDSPALPTRLQKYRRVFAARQLLALSRTHYVRREFDQAVNRYHEALKQHPASVLRWSYLRKYVRSLLRSWAKQRPYRNESIDHIDARPSSA